MKTVTVHPQPGDSRLAPKTEDLTRTRELIGVDLHNHVLASFGEWTRNVQGYAGRNLLYEFGNACINAGLGICAVTSEYPLLRLEKGSFHDRLNWMFAKYEDTLPEGFTAERFGENSVKLTRKLCCEAPRVLYLISGQTVILRDGEYPNGKPRRTDHLVLGASNVANTFFRDSSAPQFVSDTLISCESRGLLQIAEHPYCLAHYGIGEKELRERLSFYDAIETHNAQLALPHGFKFLPIIGQYSKHSNDLARDFAMRYNKPGVAVSDAHRIKDTGLAYIGVDSQALDFRSEEALLRSLRTQIINQEFICPQEQYEPLTGWVDWVSKLELGRLTGRYTNER